MTESTEKPPTPEGLAAAGERLWLSTTASYTLRPDELRILEDACREADLVDTLQAGLVGADLMVKGSMGQSVANPLFTEVRQHRSTFASLMKQLALPDLPGEQQPAKESPRSVGARKAANARWGKSA
jgi:hypothetical protein